MAKKKAIKRKTSVKTKTTKKFSGNTTTFAIIANGLNMLIFPGLGSLIGGKTKAGIWQILLMAIGIIIVSFTKSYIVSVIIGYPILIGIWIWGLVTGTQIIKESK